MRAGRLSVVVSMGLLALLALTGCDVGDGRAQPSVTQSAGVAGSQSASSGSSAPISADSTSTPAPAGPVVGKPAMYEAFGAVRLAETRDIDHATWRLDKAGSLPKACDPELLRVTAGQTATPPSGSSWVVTNTGDACTITGGALVLTRPGQKAKVPLQVGTGSKAGAQVVPAGGSARFRVDTTGPCLPSKKALQQRKSQQMQVIAWSGGRSLGTVSAAVPACEQQRVRLVLLRFTEAVRTATAPKGLTARVMTASLHQLDRRVVGTLFVTNITNRSVRTATCPKVVATVLTETTQAVARISMTCGDGFSVAPHSSLAIDVSVPVDLTTSEFALADVGAYLSLGIGDDASRGRTDA